MLSVFHRRYDTVSNYGSPRLSLSVTHRDAVAPSANEVVADQSLYAYAYHYAFAEERQNSP